MTTICKGTVFLTKRPCTKLATKNELCPYHQAQRVLLDAQAKGETFCRQFNRGCRNLLTADEKTANILTCQQCRNKLNDDRTHTCERKECNNKTEDKKRFCGKHARDVFREDAEKNGIRYCNIDRGCASVLKDDERICGLCVDKNKQKHSTELESLRSKIPNCLKCLQNPKTISHFCESCYPTIYQVSDKISYRTANNFWNDLCRGSVNRSMLMVLTFDQVTAIICRPCFYCGRFSDSVLNGLDRYDNSKGYIPSNVQPCCTMCNMMKHDMPPQAFLDKVQSIHTFNKTTTEIADDLVRKWQVIYTTQFMQTYTTYKNNVINYRKISFDLTKPQYQALHSLPCYLCGIKPSDIHKNGIDRVDSCKGYTIYNCKTCCTHCNIMKKNTDLPTFLEQCKLISAYCKIPEEEVISSAPRLKERVESYKSRDIYELLNSKQFDHFSKWAKEVGKSAQFIQGICEIYALPITDKEKTIAEIQHQMDVEVQRAFKERHATESAKHYSATSVYAMLLNGESEKFKGWYETTYGLSASFVSQLSTLIENLKTSEKSAGLEMCRKFLKAETNRRNSMVREGLKKTLKVPVERAGWTAKTIPAIPEIVPENVLILETPATPVPPVKSEPTPAPKQWKAEGIYKAIKDGNGQQFKVHCETNNTLSDMDAWNAQWTEFHNHVFEAKELKDVKEYIHDFIVALRSKRHAKLTQKDVVSRTDRQVWPKHSVLKAYQSGKFDSFKEFNESNGETGPKWESRWNALVDALRAITDESEQLTIIQKFQTNVRTARYVAKKRDVS